MRMRACSWRSTRSSTRPSKRLLGDGAADAGIQLHAALELALDALQFAPGGLLRFLDLDRVIADAGHGVSRPILRSMSSIPQTAKERMSRTKRSLANQVPASRRIAVIMRRRIAGCRAVAKRGRFLSNATQSKRAKP
jgi:hypothetical protein